MNTTTTIPIDLPWEVLEKFFEQLAHFMVTVLWWWGYSTKVFCNSVGRLVLEIVAVWDSVELPNEVPVPASIRHYFWKFLQQDPRLADDIAFGCHFWLYVFVTLTFYKFLRRQYYLTARPWLASFRLVEAREKSSGDRMQLELGADGNYRVLDDSGTVIGYVPEKQVRDVESYPVEDKPSLVKFYTAGGMVVGYGVRIDNTLCTALHVVREAKFVANAYDIKRTLEITQFRLSACGDLAILTGDVGFFSVLGVKSAKTRQARLAQTVYVVDVRETRDGCCSMATPGHVHGKEILPNLPRGLKHDVNTYRGLSGSPLWAGGKYLVGIHVGGHLKDNINVAAEIHSVYASDEVLAYDAESEVYSADFVYPRKKRFSNRIKAPNPIPDYDFSPLNWGDMDPDEDWDDSTLRSTLYDQESTEFKLNLFKIDPDFRPSSAVVGATGPSVITTSKDCSKKMNRSKSHVDKKSTNLSTGSAPVPLAKEFSRGRAKSSLSLPTYSPSSQKLENTPILQPNQTQTESSPLSCIVEAQEPSLAQGEKKQSKRRRRRGKRQKNPNGSDGVPTLSQTSGALTSTDLEKLLKQLLSQYQLTPRQAASQEL
jgi:hypothetical protein